MSQNINIRPTKINKVNLATFKSPVLEDLSDIDIQLQNLAENQISQVNFKALTIVKKSENIRASIKMSKAYGEYKVANRYVKLLSIIEAGDFNNYTEYKKAVDLGLMVTRQLSSHIEKLVENQSYLSANLWKSWSKMGLYFKEKNISINELFIPCGNFNDIKIKKAKAKDIENIVNKLVSEFKENVSDYENTAIKEVAKKSLINISDILTTLLNIKSSSTYHEYWTALKARIALALNDTNIELDNKNNLVEILDDAKINFYNFGSGTTTLKYNYLENVCGQLLSDRAISLSNSVPEIYEFYKRFYVEDFIKESKSILLSTNSDSNSLFEVHNENFKGIKYDITLIANKFKDLEKNEDTKEDLLKLIKSFINESKIERFGKKLKENEVSIILGGYVSIYKSIYSIMTVKTPFSHNLSLEFAAFHLIVEYYIDRKGDVSNDYMEILKNSTERLNCALKKDFSKLNSLPPNMWYGDVKKRLNIELYNEIMNDLKINLAEIKIAYKNFTNKSSEENLFAEFNKNEEGSDRKNNKKVISAFNNLIKLGNDFKYTESLLKIMGFKYASRLINAICVMIGSIEKNGYKLPNKMSNEIFSTALGACEIFFEDVMNGSDHPEKILESAFRKIYNDETLEIKKDVDIFEFIPLDKKIVIEENNIELNIKEKELIADDSSTRDDYKDKITNIRNSEFINNDESEEVDSEVSLDNLNESNLIMNTEKTQEDDEESKLKQIELERKRKSLEPQEISYDPNDEEFYVIDYIEEILSDELKNTFYENIQILNSDPENKKAFKELRRIFHTWKGSGKQVNLYSLGYIGEALNHLYDKRMDMNIPWNSSLQNTAQVTFDKFNYWASEMLTHNKVFFDPKEVFEALRLEEEFYKEHYSKEDSLIDDIELTSDISFPTIIGDVVKTVEPEIAVEEKPVVEEVVEPEIAVEEKPVVEEVVEPEIAVEEKSVVEEVVEPEIAVEEKSVVVEAVEPEIAVEEKPVVAEAVESEIAVEEKPVVVEAVDPEIAVEEKPVVVEAVEPEIAVEEKPVVVEAVEPEIAVEEKTLIKLTDVLSDNENDFENKAKISHEDFTISSLKELSAGFENYSEKNDIVNNDEIAENNFNNINKNDYSNDNSEDDETLFKELIKENNEKVNILISEEINNLKENKLVSEIFYENTLSLISESIQNEDVKDKIVSFEDIFHDIRGEYLTEKHISDIIETLEKLSEYVSNRTSEDRGVFERSILHLEESLFESQQEENEEISLKDDNVEDKLDMIIKELLEMKERISVVKTILTELN